MIFMRYRYTLQVLTFLVILISCKKERGSPTTDPPIVPPNPPAKHVLLKDITIPHLPSPYYHFEYNADSLPSQVNFASGFSIYDIFYNGNRIGEMRNNIIVNHDTLRYVYDPAGKLTMLKFINESNIVYRLVNFIYNGDLIKEIEWNIKEGNIGYYVDRRVTFAFYPDSNLKTMIDYRAAFNGSPEQTLTSLFELYDAKINVDDFSLVHDQYHDHLFLLQGFRLQKNNPGKETFTVNGVVFYTNDFTYTYNPDNTPSYKNGNFIYHSGSDSGKVFETSASYSYY
jgi:hypothetical protein